MTQEATTHPTALPEQPASPRHRRRPLRLALILVTVLAVLAGGLWSANRLLRNRQARQQDEAAIHRGRVFLEQGNPALALQAVNRVPEQSPVLAEALTVRGLALVALDRIEESRLTLEHSLEIGPVQPMAAKVLAAIYFSRSESDRGLDLLTLAAQVDPADFRPWFAMGDIYQRLGKPAEAAESFAEALERRADDRGSLLGLTSALLDLGNAEAATPHLEALLQATPEDSQVLELAARHALDLGRLPEALAYADSCLAIAPERVDARLTRSRIHRAAGRPDAALEDAEAAVRHAPNHLGALNLLAVTEAAAGLSERAAVSSARHRDLAARLERLHELTAQIQAQPDDPEPRWQLGQEAIEVGERTLAEQSFKAALAIDPTCQAAIDGLNRLGLATRGPSSNPLAFP
ncbi:tetratricopeptide repeat protein [Tautonia marina]|uniref:tetratricopeptide repeat protein n=1 Tax=Tautonia marina TaxID=2653855 RepID=UPI0012607142|nr:tetratricopeptide repeat protein [Tautonia marina]